MKRILIDYKRLDRDVAAKLIDLYPHGYGDDDIITLKKPNGEVIETVEVKTADTIFLVKISQSLANFISNFEETIERELGSKDAEIEAVESDLGTDSMQDIEPDSESDSEDID